MERHAQQSEKPVHDPPAAYAPPVVEDLETSQGPAVTPGGAIGGNPSNMKAAPRKL